MKVTHRPAARIALAIAVLSPAVAATVAAASAGASQGRNTSRAAAAGLRAEPASSTATAAGTRLWVALYRGSNGASEATSIATSPHRSEVFVTGLSGDTSGHQAYGTVAYSARGVRRWAASYNGPAGENFANELAVSPDGSKVFVTGYSQDASGTDDYATVAYNAATGARIWVARYAGPAGSTGNFANALAVSPDGSKVFVTGASFGSTGRSDYATVGYAARTGARRWVQRYHGPGTAASVASSVAVSPDGSKVFVTGAASGTLGPLFSDYATLAYNPATGARIWLARYDGPSGGGAAKIAVSPDGSRVFVTGSSGEARGPGYTDYATVAYDPATGARLWVARYGAPEGGNTANSMAVSPDGSKVFVTGASAGKPIGNVSQYEYATVAYDTSTGASRWVRRFTLLSTSGASATAVAVSPGGSKVFVTGNAANAAGLFYATVAYRA